MLGLLNLFEPPHGNAHFVSEPTVHNIKLPEILQLCMSKDQAKMIYTFLQRPSNAETIVKRQEFFKEFLYSDARVELFKKTRSKLRLAMQLSAQYPKENNIEIRHFLFYRIIDLYITAMTDIIDMTGTAQSCILSAFVTRIKAFCKEDAVQLAMQDMVHIRRVLQDVVSQSFEIRLHGSFILGYNTTLVNEETLPPDEELLTLFSDMGMGIETPPPNKEMQGDVFNAYIGLLIKNNKQIKAHLSSFHTRHRDLYARIVPINIDDITLILCLHDLLNYLNKNNVPLCFPEISATRSAYITDCHDLSLLAQKIPKIIPNDFICNENEGVFILTGVNSGGKTTYLRSLGVAVALFAAGLFIPAVSATIPCYDHMEALFTVKSRTRGSGRFLQEKEMITDAISHTGKTSLLLVNEIFSSVDEKTAVTEYSHVIRQLQQEACHCLLVTHLYSLVEGVAPREDIVCLTAMTGANNERLYKIKRSRGRSSNVLEILQKYALTPAQLKELSGQFQPGKGEGEA